MKTRRQHMIEWALAAFIVLTMLSPFAVWFGHVMAMSGRYPG